MEEAHDEVVLRAFLFRTSTSEPPNHSLFDPSVHVVLQGSKRLAVGYNDTSQFSRECRRMFGAPPIRDIRSLRTAAVSAVAE